MRGDGFRSSVIKQTGPYYTIKMSTGSKISDLRVEGNATALGGIDISNTGWLSIENVNIENFTGSGAVAIKAWDTYRALIEQVYVFTCDIGIHFRGFVTSFSWIKGELNTCQTYTVYAPTYSGSESIDVVLNQVTIESPRGLTPIMLGMFGQVIFDYCGFEDCCGSGANPRVITVSDDCALTLRDCIMGAFNTGVFSYSGTGHYVYMGNDAAQVTVTGCHITHNYTTSGYTLQFLRSQGDALINISDTIFEGSGFATDLVAERAFLGGINVTYGTQSLHINNCRVGNGTYITKRPPSAVTEAVTTVTGAATRTSVWSKTFPSGCFASGYGFKIKAWGKRTGTVGAKTAELKLAAGGDTFIAMTAAATAADTWESEVTVLFVNFTDQSVLVSSRDGTATNTSATQQTKDTNANDLTVSVVLSVVTAAETMTLDGLLMERF
jgi:hypothetical protein